MISDETKKTLHQYNLAALCSPPTIHNTYELTRQVIADEVPGVLVECGVYAGAHIAAMWRACYDLGVTRQIHAFDSFQGCPAASEKDDREWQATALGKACSSRENFQMFMDRWGIPTVCDHSRKHSISQSSGHVMCPVPECKGSIHAGFYDQYCERLKTSGVWVHEGWFEDTIPAWNLSLQMSNHILDSRYAISLLRLDGDLYSSTMTCLKHLYPLVSPGGFVIIDDYALKGCRAAVHEYFGDNLPEMVKIEGGGGPVWFQK